MSKILKQIFRLIFDDLALQLKTYLTILVIILLSYIPVKYIDNTAITICVVGIIIIVVLYFHFFMREKSKCLSQHIFGLQMKIIHL